nr:MAG TPA: hypothetical protein [Caudoviricetes sp.]
MELNRLLSIFNIKIQFKMENLVDFSIFVLSMTLKGLFFYALHGVIVLKIQSTGRKTKGA